MDTSTRYSDEPKDTMTNETTATQQPSPLAAPMAEGAPLLYRASPLHKPAGMWEVESELGHPVCTVNDEATAKLFAQALNTRPGGYHAAAPAEQAVVGAKPKHVDLGILKGLYPDPEWVQRADEYVKRIDGRMQEAIEAAALHGPDDYRVKKASGGAWLSATDLRGMAIERGIQLIAATQPTPEADRKGASGEDDRPAWYGVQDEVALTHAVCVMNDVLEDIAGWEDKELSEAVKSSKIDLMAMIECIRMNADDTYVPGSKPIDGETFGAATPSEGEKS